MLINNSPGNSGDFIDHPWPFFPVISICAPGEIFLATSDVSCKRRMASRTIGRAFIRRMCLVRDFSSLRESRPNKLLRSLDGVSGSSFGGSTLLDCSKSDVLSEPADSTGSFAWEASPIEPRTMSSAETIFSSCGLVISLIALDSIAEKNESRRFAIKVGGGVGFVSTERTGDALGSVPEISNSGSGS